MTEYEVFRNNHLIDPQLHIWGWEIPVYLFLGGLTAGVMILSALLARPGREKEMTSWVRWIPFLAPVLLSLGMLALFLDLEYKIHVFRFYLAFNWTSPMSWGAWILLGIYPASLALALINLTEPERAGLGKAGLGKAGLGRLSEALSGMRNEIVWANVILGIALGAYTGVLLGTLAARPVWNSIVLGPLFLVSGFSTAAALFMLLPVGEKTRHTLRNWDLLAIGVELCLLAFFFVDLTTGGGEAGRSAAGLFLGGPFTAEFWALVVGLGLLVPLILEGIEWRRRIPGTAVAPVLILIGGFALRWILVIAGQVNS